MTYFHLFMCKCTSFTGKPYYTIRLYNIYNICHRMKRKEYHQRLLISASVEQDRWRDFQELCDKERKSYSMKINELIGEELEKNQVGEHTPIRIVYGNIPNKSCQSDLTQWFDTVNNITSQQELLVIKGQASHICNLTDKRSMELHRQGIRK